MTTNMTNPKPTVRMNEPDFVEIANRAHKAFTEKLTSLKASDSSFPFWLSSAAINLCVHFGDVDLRDKLIHVDDLVKLVKHGFEQSNDLLAHLPEEELDHLEYSRAFFAETFDGKSQESKTVEVTGATVSKS